MNKIERVLCFVVSFCGLAEVAMVFVNTFRKPVQFPYSQATFGACLLIAGMLLAKRKI